MEEQYNYNPLPKETIEFNKEFPTSKQKITKSQMVIVSLSLLLIISLGYIFTELPEQDVEVIRNESLMIGFNVGVEQWNAEVIAKVNDDGVIPYYYNQTYFELNINQLCGAKE